MMKIEEAQEIVCEALQALNSELPADSHLTPTASMVLLGSGAAIDSLALVSVIVDIEAVLGNRLGQTVVLTDERAMTREPMPFSSVAALSEYIVELSRQES